MSDKDYSANPVNHISIAEDVNSKQAIANELTEKELDEINGGSFFGSIESAFQKLGAVTENGFKNFGNVTQNKIEGIFQKL